MIYKTYEIQMSKYGESYAAGLYITAALVLALSGAGLGKSYDMVAGAIFFISDLIILALQLAHKHQRLRSLLLFGMSFIGSLILLAGSIFDDLKNAELSLEYRDVIVRFISNIILVIASFTGLMTLFPKLKYSLPIKPGALYLVSYSLFFIFAIEQFIKIPSAMSFGYIITVILWLLASNAIRLKYDQGTNAH